MNQESLTKIFLSQWNKSINPVNVKFYSREWWFSNRSNNQNSLRLSKKGFDFLTKTLEISCYEIPFTEDIELNPQTLLFFDKYIECPFFLTRSSIIVFSEKKSFELYMFSDDIRRYGLVKAMNERLKEKS